MSQSAHDMDHHDFRKTRPFQLNTDAHIDTVARIELHEP